MQRTMAAATSLDRLLGPQPGHGVAVVALHRGSELGVGRDRIDRADVDVGARQLRTQRLGEPRLRRLGGAVPAHQRDAAASDDRGDEDQVAVALGAEDRQRRACGVERAEEIDVHHPPHDVGRSPFERPVVAEPGVADRHVEPRRTSFGACSTSRVTSASTVTSIVTASARPPAARNRRDRCLEPVGCGARRARPRHPPCQRIRAGRDRCPTTRP